MDVKNFLYDWCSINKYDAPQYKCEENAAAKESNRFWATATINFLDVVVGGFGFGPSCEIAKKEAANKLCENLVMRKLMIAEEVRNHTKIIKRALCYL